MNVDALLPLFEKVRKSGNGWSACCPAKSHGGDKNPSLSIAIGDSGKLILTCHKDCPPDEIIAGVGLTWAELAGEDRVRGEWTPQGEAVAVYDYTDEAGKLLYQVCRTGDKQFPQRKPDSSKTSGWTWRLEDVRRVLYRLPRLPAAIDAGQAVYVVEGEKDVHAVERAGAVATCNPGGAGKWRPEYNRHLAEARVVVVADRDDKGQAHARQVAAYLDGVAGSVMVCEPARGKDVSDHLAAGLGLDELERVSEEDERADLAPDLHEFLAGEDRYQWVVPGLLERGDRFVLTGFEGMGKSVLLRQFAVCIAAGIHPFTQRRVEPRRVLFLDCENSERHNRRQLRPLAQQAWRQGQPVPDGGMRILMKPSGIDLTREDDAAWLLERVIAHRPDVLFLGPLYRLHSSNPNEELPARKTVAAIDEARTRVDCAVVLEAHAGHGEAGKSRAVRPTGSSLFLRWPEFGYGMKLDQVNGRWVTVLQQWRGPRDERQWPAYVEKGNPWPWVACWPDGMPVDDEEVG